MGLWSDQGQRQTPEGSSQIVVTSLFGPTNELARCQASPPVQIRAV